MTPKKTPAPFTPPKTEPVIPAESEKVEAEALHPPEPSASTDSVITEREDRTLKSRSFVSWLLDNALREEFMELASLYRSPDYFVGARWLKFKFDVWADELLRADRPDLTENLLRAETEWRADAASARHGRIHMGLKDVEKVSKALRPMTDEMPVIIVDCGWTDRNERPCGQPALPGAVRCAKHGGEWLDPKIRQSIIFASYMRIVESTEIAVDALRYVAEHGKREEARVMAAKEILDRAGIRAGIDIHHHHEGSSESEQVSALRERLDQMAEGLSAREVLLEEQARKFAEQAAAEDEIVEMELDEEGAYAVPTVAAEEPEMEHMTGRLT